MTDLDLKKLQALQRQGKSLSFTMFWGHTVSKDGKIGGTCMSQWYPVGFEIENVYYQTAEHWMMAGKARLFKDEQMLEAIIAAQTPKDAKALGRKVRGFDDKLWNQNARRIVTEGNYAKFTQHIGLRDFLLSTGDSIIVEASPVDRIWGIGLEMNHRDARNPLNWPGENRLGFALMDVRDRIRNELQ